MADGPRLIVASAVSDSDNFLSRRGHAHHAARPCWHTHTQTWQDVSRKRKRQPNAIMKIHLICVYDFARRPLKRLKFNLPRKGDAQEEVATGRRVNSQHFATATATCG